MEDRAGDKDKDDKDEEDKAGDVEDGFRTGRWTGRSRWGRRSTTAVIMWEALLPICWFFDHKYIPAL